jgi:hypothetical protein
MKWLTDDDTLDVGNVDKQYVKMRSSWILDQNCFGLNFQPEGKDIHVLVELPEAAAGVSSETSAMAQMVKEIYDQVVQTKCTRYAHSRMGSSDGRKLLQDLHIHVEPVRTVHFPVGDYSTAEAFKWGCNERGEHTVLTEEKQRERYRAYVEYNIGDVLTEKKLCVIGVEKGQDILTVRVPDRPIEFSGRTDLLVLSDLVKEERSYFKFLPEVKMQIEVKRTIKSRDDFQA